MNVIPFLHVSTGKESGNTGKSQNTEKLCRIPSQMSFYMGARLVPPSLRTLPHNIAMTPPHLAY